MRKRIVQLLIVIVSLILFICISIQLSKPDVYVYNHDEKNVYIKQTGEVVMENVYAPSQIISEEIMAVFGEKRPFVGLYNVVSGECLILFYLDQLSDDLWTDFSYEDISNLQKIPGDRNAISFIYENELYTYTFIEGFSKIWSFKNAYAENSYMWVNSNQCLILDELAAVDDWKLYLYNVENSDIIEIDNHVSAFFYTENNLIYGKKRYVGAWCEWDICMINMNEMKEEKVIQSPWLDVGEIVMGNDDSIYYMESTIYLGGKDRKVYRVEESLGGKLAIVELTENERLLGCFKLPKLTVEQHQEDDIIALLEDNLPELTSYEKYIENVGGGEVNLTIQVHPLQKQCGQNYYPVYVGEKWSDHMVNWDWFYVNEAVDTIYWYDVIEGELHSLEEWRKSERYRR